MATWSRTCWPEKRPPSTFDSWCRLPTCYQVHDPAAACVRARVPAVVDYFLGVTASILEGVAQHRHRGEIAPGIHLLGDGDRAPRPPGRDKADRPKWVPEDI